jgi:hypothetical protein
MEIVIKERRRCNKNLGIHAAATVVKYLYIVTKLDSCNNRNYQLLLLAHNSGILQLILSKLYFHGHGHAIGKNFGALQIFSCGLHS